MKCPLSKQALFFFGMSVVGGEGRLTDEASNKHIKEAGEEVYSAPGTNLYIGGTEVAVNKETLAANKLYEIPCDYDMEQLKWLGAGVIAGLYDPIQKPIKWGHLTFEVTEDTYIEESGDYEIYEKLPECDLPSSGALPGYSGPGASGGSRPIGPGGGSPGTGGSYSGLIPIESSGGKIHLVPGKEYVIVSTNPDKSVYIPPKANQIVQEGGDPISPDMPKEKEEYVDPETGEDMIRIRIPIGHNHIEIEFKKSDKMPGQDWYRIGAKIHLYAVPADKWEFVQWKVNGVIRTEQDFEMVVQGDTVFNPRFRQVQKSAMDGMEPIVDPDDPANPDKPPVPPKPRYTVNININPQYETGVVEGAGVYTEGSKVTLKATPTYADVKSTWYVSNACIAIGNEINIIVTQDVTYEVRFMRESDPEYPDSAEDIDVFSIRDICEVTETVIEFGTSDSIDTFNINDLYEVKESNIVTEEYEFIDTLEFKNVYEGPSKDTEFDPITGELKLADSLNIKDIVDIEEADISQSNTSTIDQISIKDITDVKDNTITPEVSSKADGFGIRDIILIEEQIDGGEWHEL